MIPPTERILPRPLLYRQAWRQRGLPLPAANQAEIRDAIRALRDLPPDDPLNMEALRVLDEVGFPLDWP